MNQWELILRLLLAIVCGFIVGQERKNRSKEAGIRTHIIICLGSALIMIISKYGFSDLDASRFDPARMASQVVSGIGFLGAGMIIVRRQTISGLTTAAGMWATSGVGLAIGAGMYVLGIAAALGIVLVQIIFHMEFVRQQYHEVDTLVVEVDKDHMSAISTYLEMKSIRYGDMRIERLDDKYIRVEMEVQLATASQKEAILMMIHSSDAIAKVEVQESL